MSRASLALLLASVGATCFAVGRMTRPEPPPPGSLAPGARLVVSRPTGESVSAAGGALRQPKTERTALFVVKRLGEPHEPVEGAPVWLITLGRSTYVAAEVD